jgi:hypothetical protein
MGTLPESKGTLPISCGTLPDTCGTLPTSRGTLPTRVGGASNETGIIVNASGNVTVKRISLLENAIILTKKASKPLFRVAINPVDSCRFIL